MATVPMRRVVKIDEDKCDGCGLCVPSCAEGAIEIVDGKARLVAEDMCDGLGECLGHCPRGAITIEERPAERFGGKAASNHEKPRRPYVVGPAAGCPGAAMRGLPINEMPAPKPSIAVESQLRHWPIQLSLVPLRGEIWQGADVLIAADCVAFAMPEFHRDLLAGKSLAVACPKLDPYELHVRKLAAIFADNEIKSVTVAHMEVPCCTAIVGMVEEALRRARRNDIPLRKVKVSLDGTIDGKS